MMASQRLEDELYRLQLRWFMAKDEAEKKKAAEDILKLLERAKSQK